MAGVRPAVLGRETAQRLDEYRAIRHRFRSLNSFDLRGPRCRDLLRGVDEGWAAARVDLTRFATFLDRLSSERPPEA